MRIAKEVSAPVILVGDIDKGGMFAWIVGTLELLTFDERKMIKGIIINKFRGDKSLLAPGIDFLEKKTGIRVLGVIPYYKDIQIPEEDSVYLDNRKHKIKNENQNKCINVVVIKLPHISESNCSEITGLEILPIETLFEEEKILSQIKVKEISTSLEVTGYEIHHGRTMIEKGLKPFFEIIERSGIDSENFEGVVTDNNKIFGTYIHGVFDQDKFRRNFLNRIREKKNLAPINEPTYFNLDNEFDKLAEHLRKNINMNYLYKILDKEI